MFLLHYIIPIILFHFFRNKIMLFGLLLGNLIDIDHIYYRIIGKVPWFGSACPNFWDGCNSLLIYPLHSAYFLIVFIILSSLIFVNNKKVKFIGWLVLGASLNILFDYIRYLTGVVI